MNIPWKKAEMAAKIKKAVALYWRTRKAQSTAQRRRGAHDTGARSEVTGGKQLDGFVEILHYVGRCAGFDDSEMFDGKDFPVPGYYRAMKNWDYVFVKNGKLIAVVELKSHSGSLGNNQNNRIEEVLGASHDFWKAYRANVLCVGNAPWIGYFLMLKGDEKALRPVSICRRRSFLSAMDAFQGASYMRRYEILCERMILERDYSATSFLVTTRDGKILDCTNAELSFAKFCESLYRHLVAYS